MSDLLSSYSDVVRNNTRECLRERFLSDEDEVKLKDAEAKNGYPCTYMIEAGDGHFRCVVCGGLMIWNSCVVCGDCGRTAIYL